MAARQPAPAAGGTCPLPHGEVELKSKSHPTSQPSRRAVLSAGCPRDQPAARPLERALPGSGGDQDWLLEPRGLQTLPRKDWDLGTAAALARPHPRAEVPGTAQTLSHTGQARLGWEGSPCVQPSLRWGPLLGWPSLTPGSGPEDGSYVPAGQGPGDLSAVPQVGTRHASLLCKYLGTKGPCLGTGSRLRCLPGPEQSQTTQGGEE